MPGPRKEGGLGYLEIPQTPPEIIQTLGFSELEKAIRQVKLFNDSIKGLHPYLKSTVTLEEVPIQNLHPCALYVLNQNLRTQRELRNALKGQKIDTHHFSEDRSFIQYRWGGEEHVLIPPIVEVSEDDGGIFVITDGLHRVTNAREAGEKSIACIVIRNTAVPLSPLPVVWDEIKRLDHVPPTKDKRKLRFQKAEDVFRWFGLNNRNLERVLGGFENPEELGYKAFFRDLDLGPQRVGQSYHFSVPNEPAPSVVIVPRGVEIRYEDESFVKSQEECLRDYNHAGVLITTPDFRNVLLGNPKEAPDLWGNFAGHRESTEKDPKITAARELEEELGLEVNPSESFGRPLIIIKNFPKRIRVAFVYPLLLDRNTVFSIPGASEIEGVKWYGDDGIASLMDEGPPDYRLWGGIWTAETLNRWHRSSFNQGTSFAGRVQINSWPFGVSLYEEYKNREQVA